MMPISLAGKLMTLCQVRGSSRHEPSRSGLAIRLTQPARLRKNAKLLANELAHMDNKIAELQ